MARPKTKRVVTKPHQIVTRLSDERLKKLDDIIEWTPYDVKRVNVIERAIDELHASMKGRRSD